MELILFSPSAIFLFLILCVVLILIRHIKKLIFGNHVNLPPGRLGWPIIGESLDFVTSARTGFLDRFIFDRMSRYSSEIFKSSILGAKMVFLCDTSGKKFVFSNENKLVKTWFPGSVLKLMIPSFNTSSPEEEFLRRRKLFSEFLKPDAVQRYVETMDATVRQHMDSEWAPRSSIRVHPMAKKLSFSLARCLFMGIDYPLAQIDSLQDQFEKVTTAFITIPIDLPWTTFRRGLKAANFMRAELQDIIRSKKLESLSEKNDSRNFMSHLLSTTDDEGKLLSESDIANLVLGILIASHDNTSSLFTNIVYYLADNPLVYTLALKEQLEIERMKGGKRLLTWEDTKKMKYGRNVINEVLRLSPPAGGFFREAIHDISYEGFTIPKGWKILCSNSTHKNPTYFPNPQKFDPARFEMNDIVPYSFTPFGGGPRMCPGYEFARQAALVFMHNLLINFKWEKIIPGEKIIFAPVSCPANGLPIKLQRRSGDTTSTTI